MNYKKLQKLRHLAFLEQGCRCIYCELPMWEGEPSRFMAKYQMGERKAMQLKCTAEHLLAARDGGIESAQNIAAACLWCNRKRHLGRGDRAPNPMQYKKRILDLMRKQRWHPAATGLISPN